MIIFIADEKLLTYKMDVEQEFLTAVLYNDIKTVKELLEVVDPSYYNNEAIISASEEGYTELVKLLLSDPRVDPGARNNKALKEASYSRRFDIVLLLLADKRVDPSVEDNVAFRVAYNEKQYDIVKQLFVDPRTKRFKNRERMRNIFEDELRLVRNNLRQLVREKPEIASDEGYLLFLMLAGPILEHTRISDSVYARAEELNIELFTVTVRHYH